jgi:GTPase
MTAVRSFAGRVLGRGDDGSGFLRVLHHRHHQAGDADVERGLDQVRAVRLHAIDHGTAVPLRRHRQREQLRRADRRVLAVDQQIVESGLRQDLDDGDVGDGDPGTDDAVSADDLVAKTRRRFHSIISIS